MVSDVKRDSFKTFWDRYSDTPDTNAMMLNNNAEELETADRADILQSLPDLKNKDAVDIGAGIGRFTTVLAETARWVLSTDFIESFIKKNQERNAHLGNIHYQVGDAVNLKLDNNSVDLVFTNWLMMYLSDKEVVEFLSNTMRWLRPMGFLHLRESCSEPSTARTKGVSMHTADTNPTHYRFSSLYIQLLRNFRYKDENGKVWRFDVQWSCSVPTYIKRQNNWRQVHWLTKKVPAEENETVPTFDEYVEMFSKTWFNTQKEWDTKLDEETFTWTDKIIGAALDSESVPQNSTVYAYTPRTSSPFVHINSHLLAERFTCNVWNTETVPWYYRTSLTKANQTKDKRVRFGWNESLTASVDYWKQREGEFNTLIATELLATNSVEEIKELQHIMHPEAKVVLLEPTDEDEESVRTKAISAGFKGVQLKDVTAEALEAQKEYFEKRSLNESVVDKKWFLVEATM